MVDGERQSTETVEDSDYDRSAESFLDVEAALSAGQEDEPADARYGLIVGADRVDADDVPPDYPWSVATEEALALDVELQADGRTIRAYFEWSPGDGDDRLDRLLAVAGVSYERFADLHGTRLLVAPTDDYLVPVVPPRQPRGSAAGYYGIVGGLAFNALAVLAMVLSPASIATLGFFLLFLAVNLLVIPAGTLVDARRLRTRTDWDQGPSFWAFMAALPLLNAVVSLAYLRSRKSARPLTKS